MNTTPDDLVAYGRRLRDARERAENAMRMSRMAANNNEARDKMQAANNHPDLQILTDLGLHQKYDTTWDIENPLMSVLAATIGMVRLYGIQTQPSKDGITRVIARSAIAEYFIQNANAWRRREVMPLTDAVVAYILAHLPGDGWYATDDGWAIQLPLWPERWTNPIKKVNMGNRLSTPCTAWVVDDCDGSRLPALVMGSFLGTNTKLKGVRAGWQLARRGKSDSHIHGLPQRTGDDSLKAIGHPDMPYASVAAPLSNDFIHMVMAVEPLWKPQRGQPMYHIAGEDGTPDLDLLYWQLQAALSIPLARAWMDTIWQHMTEVVTTLRSYGCVGYRIATDEAAWVAIIGKVTGLSTTLTRIAAPTATTDIEIEVEGDEDSDDGDDD